MLSQDSKCLKSARKEILLAEGFYSDPCLVSVFEYCMHLCFVLPIHMSVIFIHVYTAFLTNVV